MRSLVLLCSFLLLSVVLVPCVHAEEYGATHWILVEPSLLVGASIWKESEGGADYGHYSDTPSSSDSTKRQVAASSELGLLLGVRLEDHFQVGGYARMALARYANVRQRDLDSNLEVVPSFGAQLTISQHADTGVFVTLRAGSARLRVDTETKRAFNAGAGVGYGIPLGEHWSLGLSAEFSWFKAAGESWQGDHSEYRSAQSLLVSGLAARVRYR
jgi:hypothetical protein